jgi:signal peptidase II
MRRASSPQSRCGIWPFFLIALGVVVADQLTKWGIRSSLLEGQSLFAAGIFKIARFPPNTGAAFGLFQDQPFALAIVAIFGIAFLLVYAFLLYRYYPVIDNPLGWSALGLILGGITGNLIDRLCYLFHQLGGITDFISIGWWPAFNIADSAIVVGAILVVYSLLFLTKKQ